MLTIEGKQVCESLAEVVDPQRAALAVIDIENVPAWDEGPDRIIFDKVKVLTGVARRRGVPVFYFYNHRNRGLTDASAAVIRSWLNLGRHPDRLHEEFEPDFDHVRVHPGLELGAPPTRTTTSPWSATARAPLVRPATRRPCASSGTSGWT